VKRTVSDSSDVESASYGNANFGRSICNDLVASISTLFKQHNRRPNEI